MKLHEALRKTIREYGISVIREKRLMGFLGDCRAFDEYPAVRDVMKAIVSGALRSRHCCGYVRHVWQRKCSTSARTCPLSNLMQHDL